jgi:putative two-component system response regulator
MAIADVYDALVSNRPYKSALSHVEVVEIIKKDSGTHFDPELVNIFLACEKKFERVPIK